MDDETRARLTDAYLPLRRFAAVVGPSDVEPDDLVQEAFARVLRRGLGGIDDLQSYLRRAVLNLASNERRRLARRRRALSLVSSETSVVPSSFADAADLFRLAPEARAVLWLAEVEGWSYPEIGRLLGCTEEAARARASRGRRELRAQLAEEA